MTKLLFIFKVTVAFWPLPEPHLPPAAQGSSDSTQNSQSNQSCLLQTSPTEIIQGGYKAVKLGEGAQVNNMHNLEYTGSSFTCRTLENTSLYSKAVCTT